jgi:hypothetical protein
VLLAHVSGSSSEHETTFDAPVSPADRRQTGDLGLLLEPREVLRPLQLHSGSGQLSDDRRE